MQGPEEGRGKTNFPGQAGWSRWGRKCKSPVRRTERRDFEVPNSLSTAVGLGFNFKIACYEAREAVKSYYPRCFLETVGLILALILSNSSYADYESTIHFIF